jgi:hypothetical protein
MKTKTWELDEMELCQKAKNFLKKFNNYKNNTKYKVGQKITFYTGYFCDILASGKIKAIGQGDIYVYVDAYWYPIQDDSSRRINLTI